MNVVKLPQTDVIAVAPGCYDLPMAQAIQVMQDGKHLACLVTCWELTEEELEEVKKTKRLYLRLVTAVTPPVSLEVYDPFLIYGDIIPLKEAMKTMEQEKNN